MLTNTCSLPSAKSSKCVRMIFIALALPSFRSELKWILVVLLIVMIRHRLNIDSCSFKNRNIRNIVVFLSDPSKHASPRPIISRCLVLNPINIVQLFQMCLCDIFVTFNDVIDLLSEFLLDLTVLWDIIDHHFSKMACCISASCKEGAEFFSQLFVVVTINLLFIEFYFIWTSILSPESFFVY